MKATRPGSRRIFITSSRAEASKQTVGGCEIPPVEVDGDARLKTLAPQSIATEIIVDPRRVGD